MILRQLRTSVLLLLTFTFATGFLYPLIVTGAAHVFFPFQAGGSLIRKNGQIIGSRLIGQQFDAPLYFRGRPSATMPRPYDAGASAGSNMGPLNPVFLDTVRQRMRTFIGTDSIDRQPVPVDLVTASGSGLDPDITPAAALFQVPRVSRERGISRERIRSLVNAHTEGRQFGFLGEPRINVLLLNLELDTLEPDSVNGQL